MICPPWPAEQSWIDKRVAVLFQDFARFTLTARENIGLGRVERLADFEAILRTAERAGRGYLRESVTGALRHRPRSVLHGR